MTASAPSTESTWLDGQTTLNVVRRLWAPHPAIEAVKKPIALSAKESARVFLWIALADLGGFVFPLFSACGGF
jgi:hypothetical protein